MLLGRKAASTYTYVTDGDVGFDSLLYAGSGVPRADFTACRLLEQGISSASRWLEFGNSSPGVRGFGALQFLFLVPGFCRLPIHCSLDQMLPHNLSANNLRIPDASYLPSCPSKVKSAIHPTHTSGVHSTIGEGQPLPNNSARTKCRKVPKPPAGILFPRSQRREPIHEVRCAHGLLMANITFPSLQVLFLITVCLDKP
jgi:hypothetical protein